MIKPDTAVMVLDPDFSGVTRLHCEMDVAVCAVKVVQEVEIFWCMGKVTNVSFVMTQ
jgi:hypothetical protein